MPAWLATRMAKLGAVISEAIVTEYGRDELLSRLAQPFWFQSFGAVMGMDWHSSGITTSSLTLKDFITHLIPTSIFDGMAKNEILQIVVFSIFFGTAAAAVGARATPLIDAVDGIAHIMLKVTGYVMNFAPVAVFAALAGNRDVDVRGKAFMSWFGPKGVATMTFALFVLASEVPEAERIANLAALTVFASVIVHGLTDQPGAEWMARQSERSPSRARTA